MADIAPLILSYPDFILGQMIDPEEFDQNNTEIVNKVNETIDVVNIHTVEISDIDTKADNAVTTATNLGNEAKAIANSAETKADNAVTTATTLGNEAKTIATNLGNEAKATAGSAETKADNAVTTANTALGQDVVEPYTGALGAMKIATDIKTDYDLLRPEIVQAVSDAEAAVSSIVDKVSTEQLNNAIIDAKNAVINEIDRKEPVATYDDLYTTYPDAEDGWLCMVRASRNMYMYNIALGEWELRPTEIIYADEIGTDGIVTSEKFVEWNNKADLDENGNVPLEQLGNIDISDVVDDLAGVGRTTETIKGNADNLATHLADYALFKNGAFELWASRSTNTYKTIFDSPTAGDITEEIRNTISGDLVASKVTKFDTPNAGDITETLFIAENNVTVSKVTTFNPDGSITEVVV